MAISGEGRSRIMSAIHRKDTQPELSVRRSLRAAGAKGYRVDFPLPGRPDIYFSRYKLCIFIDGCFWHGCPIHYVGTVKNTDYWLPKIQKNVKRDLESTRALEASGYRVMRFWEHDVLEDDGRSVGNQIIERLRDLGWSSC